MGNNGAIRHSSANGGAQQQLIHELYFKRDLNEVHLLIDFVSGRPERTLDRLTMLDPDPRAGGRPLNAGEIVARIALMRYPPPEETRVMNAQNAAFLLLAKDHLSALASPARALTIAYTEMFIGAEGWLSRLWHGLGSFWPRTRPTSTITDGASPRGLPSPEGPTEAGQPQAPSPAQGQPPRRERPYAAAPGSPEDELPLPRDYRVELAYATFPLLKPHADRFKRFHGFLVWFCLIWFLLTALTYWDVSLGRSVLQRLDQFWKDRSATLLATPELHNPLDCDVYERGDQKAPPPKSKDAKVAAACIHLWGIEKAREEAREDLTRIFRCSEQGWGSGPLHVWCWSWILAGGVEPEGYSCKTDPYCRKKAESQAASGSRRTDGVSAMGSEAQPNSDIGSDARVAAATAGAAAALKPAGAAPERTEPPDHVHWQSAQAVLSAYTTYILPMMFGLLGTMIGAFRGIQAKVRDSELAPRDYALTILGLPLGAVAGVAVGLFFSPNSVPMPGSEAVAGALSLTAAGLGFLGGYGSQTFFRFIDELLIRVFSENTPTREPPLPVLRPALPAAVLSTPPPAGPSAPRPVPPPAVPPAPPPAVPPVPPP
jgi:hypothetical protein